MKKNFIFRLLPLIALAIALQSCRTNEDYLSTKEESYYTNKFQVFIPPTETVKVDYPQGFAFLFKEYDRIHSTNFTGLRISEKESLSQKENTYEEHVDFSISSQAMKLDNGETWVYFPVVENNQVINIAIGMLQNDETYVMLGKLNQGENYNQMVLQKFRLAYLKKTLSTSTSRDTDKPTCGFKGLPPCDIEVVDIPAPSGPYHNTPYLGTNPSEGGGGGGGGCAPYNNCGGGGGTTPTTPPEDPCKKMKTIGKDAKTKSLLTDLKGKTTSSSAEHGFILNKNNSITETPIQGQPGSAGINFSVTNPIDGVIHSHYQGLLSIFSPDDMLTIANLFNNGMINDIKTFIIGVVTASGTQYMMVIDDPIKFGAFASNVMSGNQLDQGMIDNYSRIYDQLFKITPQNPVSSNETNFVHYLETNNTGLKLLKGSSDFNNWSLLSRDTNGNIVPQNCP